MAEPTIELRGLTQDFGDKRILDGIDLAVERGEIFGYIGANGAGKTTTLKILTGILRPTGGDARILGKSVLDEPLWVKARIGYVPESGAIFEKLTPREYLTAMGQLYRVAARGLAQRIEEILARFRIAERIDQQMDVFSKGTKQKVCIAAALLHDPEVLFLDEPLNGLDVETVLEIKELMKSAAAAGKTVLYTSHLVDVVEKVCNRIGVLHRGRLIAVDTIPALLASTATTSLESALIKLWRDAG
jgi:ABC-2 type transport system ATP-binding protein